MPIPINIYKEKLVGKETSPSSEDDNNSSADDWLLGCLLYVYLWYFEFLQSTKITIAAIAPMVAMTTAIIKPVDFPCFSCWHTLMARWVKRHCLFFGIFCLMQSETRTSLSSSQQAEHGLHSVYISYIIKTFITFTTHPVMGQIARSQFFLSNRTFSTCFAGLFPWFF